MTAAMAFLSYTPRADSGARGYDAWLRAVDNPFFNSRPGVAGYTNWMLPDSRDLGFTHFDFMRFTDGASPADVFGDSAVRAFVGEWTRLWGRVPDGAPADNCQCYYALSEDAAAEPDADRVMMAFDADLAGGETWTIAAGMIGEAPFGRFARRFVSASDAPPGLAATLIAGPRLAVPA